MKRTSLDGRSQQPPKVTSNLKLSAAAANLRPASPPKKNPWQRRMASVASSEEFPAPPRADAAPGQGDGSMAGDYFPALPSADAAPGKRAGSIADDEGFPALPREDATHGKGDGDIAGQDFPALPQANGAPGQGDECSFGEDFPAPAQVDAAPGKGGGIITDEDFPPLPGADTAPRQGDMSIADGDVLASPKAEALGQGDGKIADEDLQELLQSDTALSQADTAPGKGDGGIADEDDIPTLPQADTELPQADIAPGQGDEVVSASPKADQALEQEKHGRVAGEASRRAWADSCPPIPEETNPLNEDKTSDAISTCSSESRKFFEAAASRASENLWNYPFGADIHVYVESTMFRVHRGIVTQKSAYFRDHLPPPNEDGTPVDFHVPYSVGAVGPCLMFMYTNRVDMCDKDDTWPLNSIHLPRCVLAYCAAVALRVTSMASHLLRVVEKTASDLGEYLGTYFIDREMDRNDGIAFTFHIANALNIIHNKQVYELMRPMRLALAGVLDASLPCLLRQPVFAEILLMPGWQLFAATISADQIDYRKTLGYSHPLRGSVLPSEDELEALYESVFKRLNGEGAVSGTDNPMGA